MRRSLLFTLFVLAFVGLRAQEQQHPSIHQEELEYWNQSEYTRDAQFDSLNGTKFIPSLQQGKSACQLEKIVFGYHPYWVGSTYLNYRWDLLSDLCYFSYEVDTLTGNALSTHSWATAAVIDSAKAHGVRVHLCVTLFDGHSYFFSHSSVKQTLITNLINLVQTRGADGVNIDFEAVPSSQSANLTAFLIDLCNQMHAAIPGSKVSIASPAVNWSSTFDIATLNSYLDWFVIMGYDYYWSGSSTSGPLSGLYSMTCGTYDNLSRTLTYYLNTGASKNKVVLALPYYGRQWKTTSSTVPSNTIAGTSSSKTYKVVKDNTSGYYSAANRGWETSSLEYYYVFNDGTNWNQCFADDEKSLAYRYDMVWLRDIAGIGIWALGYDDTYSELWDVIEDKLTDCRVIPCSDTLYDLGGPSCNHFDNESFIWTLAPTGATGLSLDFTSFSLEQDWDSLYIYDGPSIASPLIGGFSGTVSPGTVNASGNSLTLRYFSDNATTRPGWMAIWNCSTDIVLPETQVTVAPWETDDFTAVFTDTDNVGVDEKLYQVLDYNGTEWRANSDFGFFNDNFTTSIHPEWTVVSGTWAINASHLNQTDVANANTNIWASLQQSDSLDYLYHWQMNLSGSVANRRAGLHFFCDSAQGVNRGNSYFVYYRADDDKVQIYKCVDDTYYLETNISCPIDTNTWYDCKVLFRPQNGDIFTYLNNELITYWHDATPFSGGDAISLRTGNCNAMYDDIKVYHSRNSSAQIIVGPSGEARYQNPDSLTAACRIKTIITDVSGLWSNVSGVDVNIDWTPPDTSIINDGASADIDTSIITTSYSANWNAAQDSNSGIADYSFAIGTTPGDSNVFAWTSLGNVLSHLQSGLSLNPGTWYYFSLKAENGAGLISPVFSSDGVYITTTIGIDETINLDEFSVFPNPFTDQLSLSFTLDEAAEMQFVLYSAKGERVALSTGSFDPGPHNHALDISKIKPASSVYFLVVYLNGKEIRKVQVVRER